MKKGLIVAILLLVFCAGIVAISTQAMAFQMPAVCANAGYGPQWAWQCIVAICMELWINPIDYLSGDAG